MAFPRARAGLSHILSSSPSKVRNTKYHTPRRNFASSSAVAAFANSYSRAAATTTTPTAAKPSTATKSTAAKPATSIITTTTPRTVAPTFTPKDSLPVSTSRTASLDSATDAARRQRSLTDGLQDQPPELAGGSAIDWTRSYHGLGGGAFTPEQAEILLAPIEQDDVEVKPDGLLYLPEIKYRRILNKTFGPGGWGLAPRGESIVTGKLITREYGLIVQGRLVSIARGEQQYFDPDGIPTATEGCKSNALRRCCKDLGIASELWDPRFIRTFTKALTKEVWVEHTMTKKKKKIVLRKDDTVKYPFKETK